MNPPRGEDPFRTRPGHDLGPVAPPGRSNLLGDEKASLDHPSPMGSAAVGGIVDVGCPLREEDPPRPSRVIDIC